MEASTIVVATDLSESAGAAARWAHRIGSLTGLPVVVVHIAEVGFEGWLRRNYEIELDERKRAFAESTVARWYHEATGDRPGGVDVHVDFCVPGLRKVVDLADAGMLVMTRTGKSALTRAFTGSRVQTLVDNPPCPLVVVEPTMPQLPTGELRIAAATDSSEAGTHAVRVAASMAQLSRSPLSVVQVIAAPIATPFGLEPQLDELQRIEAAEQRLAQSIGELPGVELATEILQGHPATCLEDYATRHRLDLLALGATGARHGRSTNRRLLRELPCNLMIVPG